jgi:hypothetical protein
MKDIIGPGPGGSCDRPPAPGAGIGSGDAAAAAVTGWIDRRPAAVRDLLVALLTGVLAGVYRLGGAVDSGGWDALAQVQVWAGAGAAVIAALTAWAVMVVTTITRAYGTGRQ